MQQFFSPSTSQWTPPLLSSPSPPVISTQIGKEMSPTTPTNCRSPVCSEASGCSLGVSDEDDGIATEQNRQELEKDLQGENQRMRLSCL